MDRRQFLRAGVTLGALGASGTPARLMAAEPRQQPAAIPVTGGPLRLNYNENPLGLSPVARQAIQVDMGEAHRYPDALRDAVREVLARRNGVRTENVVLGNGSTELLQMIVQAASTPNAGLILASPTFEAMSRYQRPHAYQIEKVPLDVSFGHDIGRMREVVEGRRRPTIVYICNPNNPTGTLTASAAVDAWIEEAPETVLFAVDEAYIEYVNAPGYWSAIKWIADRPNVIVVRTFSKIYAMAGLRLGYAFAHPATARRLREFMSSDNANALALAAAHASLADPGLVERSRLANLEAMRIVTDCLDELEVDYLPSHASFLMHRVRGDLGSYIGRMRERGVLVGRPFAPLLEYNRLSMGVPAEMPRVVEAWRELRGLDQF